MKNLTPSDVEFYKENGYLLVGKALPDEQLARLHAIIAERLPSVSEKTSFMVNLRKELPYITEVASQPHIASIMTSLIGPNVRLWHDQFVIKFPDKSAEGIFPWHQDNGYADSVSPDNNITLWVALDKVTVENGCVWVVPGSHKQGRLEHKVNGGSWHMTLDVEGDGIPAEMEAGEAIAFSAYTLHRSKSNLSTAPRRALFLEFCDADTHINGEPVNHRTKGYMVDNVPSPIVAGVSTLPGN
ncbi:phytanoyl-CoA dioxygenase family protein [Oscillatoria amoena NRMC-F 0135]|nr:phytanoyl-CoA dioxygenase family protein [Oscillatoria laete-virens]MDL5047542.1 phytanoyl-CoA dioxygenase family protein [Oscillatoria amoena NRMC-F 0135]MDL5054635.1 phytanoyl-CoA dioxygenase family protein [Oscillatoria laete-virens NRMC-F 0139]